MKQGFASIAMACLSVLLMSGAAYAAQERVFLVGDDRDSVSFTSDAPIELIVGHTNKVRGSVAVPSDLSLASGIKAEFEVDLGSIDTGIPLRNEHMRDNFLETGKFPKAVFKVAKVSSEDKKLVDGKKTEVKGTGVFSLHGVSVTREIPVSVTYRKRCPAVDTKFPNCDLIQIKSTFPVKLEDFGIKRPTIVFQKLADTVFVTISVSARSKQ